MVGVFFSAVVAAASSSQYDGGSQQTEEPERRTLRDVREPTDSGSVQWTKGKSHRFRRSMRMGNAPELASRDGRPESPMNGEKKTRLSSSSYLETWRGEVMLVGVPARTEH